MRARLRGGTPVAQRLRRGGPPMWVRATEHVPVLYAGSRDLEEERGFEVRKVGGGRHVLALWGPLGARGAQHPARLRRAPGGARPREWLAGAARDPARGAQHGPGAARLPRAPGARPHAEPDADPALRLPPDRYRRPRRLA